LCSALKPTFLAGSRNCESDYSLHRVCPCVRTEQHGSHCSNFQLTFYFNTFRKYIYIEKIRVPLKSVKEKVLYMKPSVLFDHILRNFSRNEKYFRQTLWVQSRHTFYIQKLFRKSNRMFNTHCFSIATTVTPSCLNIMIYVHHPSDCDNH
jgi:hypothetical protein